AGRAIEVEEVAGSNAGSVLQHKMTVEKDGLNLRKHAVVAIEVGPAGLHHADLRLGKMVDDFHEPVDRRHEIGVEDGHELAFGDLEAGIQGASFVAVAVSAVDVDDRTAQ